MAVGDGLDSEAQEGRRCAREAQTGHKHLPVAPWDVGAKQHVCNYQGTNVRQPQGKLEGPAKALEAEHGSLQREQQG